MAEQRALLTVFTLILKAEARDYRKGRYISDTACGVVSVGQSEQTALAGRWDFLENKAFERDWA